jgi:protein O-GlcNAc transferase
MDELAKTRESLRLVELGSSLMEEGHFLNAAEHFDQATRLAPTNASIHLFLGNALLYAGDFKKAAAAYQKAININPIYVEAHNNLGAAKRESHQLHEAIEHFKAALAINPTYYDATLNLGTTYQDADMPIEALASFRAAFAMQPQNTEIASQIVHLQQQLCEWNNLDQLSDHLIQSVSEPPKPDQPFLIPPFAFLTLHHPTTPAQQWKCAHAWTDGPRGMFRHLPAVEFPEQAQKSGQTKSRPRIRIGYLSADFRYHATAFLITELIEAHNRERFEIYAYSYGPNDQSVYRKRIEQSVDCFREVSNASFEDTAKQIREDDIDILVDLKGLTQQARTEVLGFRPAPIQVNFLGYPSTMGTRLVDYIIVDSFITPIEQQPYYSEQLVQLPGCYQPNDHFSKLNSSPPDRSQHGIPPDAFVFCAFNNSYKIGPRIFDVWMELLRDLPSSVLWLFETNQAMVTNLTREAAMRGIPAERLIFSKSVDRQAHLARLPCADLFLDTFPVSGHTTASDTLRAGLPLLTIVGETFVSRVAGSLLRTLALDELIATNYREYQQKALDLARNPNLLASFKQQLHIALSQSSLFKPIDFARKLETAFEIMWLRHCRGEAPSPLPIPTVDR